MQGPEDRDLANRMAKRYGEDTVQDLFAVAVTNFFCYGDVAWMGNVASRINSGPQVCGMTTAQPTSLEPSGDFIYGDLMVIATCDVKRGEELTFPYGEEHDRLIGARE